MKNRMLHLVLSSLSVLVAFVAFGPSALAFTHLTSQMSVGSRGAQVTALQNFLASNPSVYPQGLVTGYFGPLTMDAVSQFQIGYALPAVGRVGPLTLQALDNLIDTGRNIDVDAPTLFGVSSSVTGRNVTISWDNNEAVTGKVYYDRNPINIMETSQAKMEPVVSGSVYGTTDGSTLAAVKSVYLQNLQPLSTYYYVVESMDAAGNVSITLPGLFTTGQ